uniref:Ras and Rab interactor 2 n=1 Tax=Takifugu rubripes TaxID=31033 RepID=A0A3B5KKF4_TAKRU
MSLCVSPPQSFLIVCDPATSQPGLLVVSAGEEQEGVLDYHIQTTGTAFRLSESRLSFPDLAQLVFFYSLTRDVLPGCLTVPRWIYSVTAKNREHLSRLQPEAWLSTPPDLQADAMTQRELSNVVCSIQLTSANGALCIINPLYIHDHGDDWLTHRATAPTQLSGSHRQRFGNRPVMDTGMASKRPVSLNQELPVRENSGLVRATSADSPQSASGGVVLRRLSSASGSYHRASADSLPPSTPSTPQALSSSASDLQSPGSQAPPSPHRVSWIEDGVWLPPPRPSSLLPPPSLELDTLSISSIEEEQESGTSNINPHVPSTQSLASKVVHRLSVVGQALGGLVCQKKRLTNRVQELSRRRAEPFSEAVKEFVEVTLRSGANHNGALEFLQGVRSSLTSLRETLLESQEVQALLDSITDISDPEIDTLIELSLHKVALKPVSAHLNSCIHASRTSDGTVRELQSNMRVLEKKGIKELGGSADVGVPDAVTLERIQQRWTSLHEAYSPNKKVHILLKVCKSIYHSMSANATSGSVHGADDFLPCLTWVLLRSDAVTLQIDTDYMMELLDPTQLQGEGGYYLTTLYASLYYISSFQPRLAARQLSVEAQESLNQWHRRRTLYCNRSRRSPHRQTIRKPGPISRMKAGTKGEHGAKPSEQEPGCQGTSCVQDSKGKSGLEEVAEAPSLGREPGRKEEVLAQSSETERVVKEEDSTEIPEKERENKEEVLAQSSETELGGEVRGVRQNCRAEER